MTLLSIWLIGAMIAALMLGIIFALNTPLAQKVMHMVQERVPGPLRAPFMALWLVLCCITFPVTIVSAGKHLYRWARDAK